MRQLVQELAEYPRVLLATNAGLLIGFVAILALGATPSGDTSEAHFLVNLFKFGVGVYCMAISLFLYYGPILNEHGIAQRVTPSRDAPTGAIILYFGFGVGAIMASVAITRPGLAQVLFWQMAGFSLFLALATGYFVWILEQVTDEVF